MKKTKKREEEKKKEEGKREWLRQRRDSARWRLFTDVDEDCVDDDEQNEARVSGKGEREGEDGRGSGEANR